MAHFLAITCGTSKFCFPEFPLAEVGETRRTSSRGLRDCHHCPPGETEVCAVTPRRPFRTKRRNAKGELTSEHTRLSCFAFDTFPTCVMERADLRLHFLFAKMKAQAKAGRSGNSSRSAVQPASSSPGRRLSGSESVRTENDNLNTTARGRDNTETSQTALKTPIPNYDFEQSGGNPNEAWVGTRDGGH